MKIYYSSDFQKEYKRLPLSIQRIYQRQESLLCSNWRDPRLHIKKLKEHAMTFSFRITRRYRVLFMFINNDTALFSTIDHRKDAYKK